ncbi:hypothetical protein BAY61_28155 [Prauserella marina]|uniref:Uncharacterized conserved protein YecE, DUF72 family n=1 Tax=Prauserella marina TaxID=530584 RepID=A0A222VWE7_9PSEU|nr:DUF72 domain-containing protein [Prauserella marina]ASR38237.1 hypothetical protein BAY61_28155 [Prauserella marina]PWV78571.1 uncharacterized protein YecE (DUF72 family) [Prauserella marina]SDC89047.1 Uncharacterized conserved protein YecE, DUF72 family [Prauserella marina]
MQASNRTTRRHRGQVRIGTSGWLYPPWRETFYPKGLAHRRELEYLASRVGTVEINGSFYSLQRPASYETWYSQTPDDFVFAVKGGRFITHMKQLRGVDSALSNFFASGVLALGSKLGPVLWQLPPRLAFDEQRLASFFDVLPRNTVAAADLARHHDDKLKTKPYLEVIENKPIRHALEVRHPSFTGEAFVNLLHEYDIALVVADTAGKWPYSEEVTTDFVYVRLHGDKELYASGYTERALRKWAEKITAWRSGGKDVYVYFDNDMKVKAPGDAMNLAKLVDHPEGGAIPRSAGDAN